MRTVSSRFRGKQDHGKRCIRYIAELSPLGRPMAIACFSGLCNWAHRTAEVDCDLLFQHRCMSHRLPRYAFSTACTIATVPARKKLKCRALGLCRIRALRCRRLLVQALLCSQRRLLPAQLPHWQCHVEHMEHCCQTRPSRMHTRRTPGILPLASSGCRSTCRGTAACPHSCNGFTGLLRILRRK